MMIETEHLHHLICRGVEELQLPADLPGLYLPITYTLESGGKRLRPMLLLAACQAMGVDPEEALSQALGIEMFHNFTLLHDDVMDRADTRRGRPTVHCKWNVPTAILSGDTMLTLATQLMMRCPDEKLRQVLTTFNDTAVEIYEGQQMDMDFEQRTDVTEGEYLEMIRLKTAVLPAAALYIGAIMGHGTEQTARHLYDFGINLGLAFQLRDDYLDTFGDEASFGKKTGGDIVNNKKTWLLINALDTAPDEAVRIIAISSAAEKISAMTALYRQLDLHTAIRMKIDEYTTQALDSLALADLSPACAQWFEQLTLSLTQRRQ